MSTMEETKFEETLLEIRRVTRVTTWGRRLSFRATVLVWDKNWKIWLGVGKSGDVLWAIKKATHQAYKNIQEVTVTETGSVPYAVTKKYKSSIVKLIPAAPGTGLKAGSSVRSVLELAGYTNILSKIVWTNNKLNNALVTIQILTSFKKPINSPKKEEESKKEENTDKSNVVEETIKKETAKKVAEEKKDWEKETKKKTEKTAKKTVKKEEKKTTTKTAKKTSTKKSTKTTKKTTKKEEK